MKPINLNRARKARARTQAKADADANAVRFGRTKAQKTAEKLEAERLRRTVDGAERE